ncbi:uncharacterized protein V6R79_023328 [Siganus canaliculatus]
MPGNGGVYAVKRRKKPVQKIIKPPPAKTNPSKRHRDRLNGELENLTSLLPFSEEVRGRLDKLSVLRLSVGYLKVKSYFHASLHKRSPHLVSTNGRNGRSVSLDGVGFSEGDLLLQALSGFVLVVTTDGTVFYASPTIQDFLGFHQSDVVHQSIYDLIHVDDRDMFKCQLHFALNPGPDNHSDVRDAQLSNGETSGSCRSSLTQYIPPENSSFLERSFCCRLRCLLDNTSGFLALNFNGRLKNLHLQGSAGPDGAAPPPPPPPLPPLPQLALFAIATPVQPPSVMEIRTKTLIFQSKHRMDFAPMGMDTRGRLVLGYSETELVTPGSGYQFIHAADMMYCADNHLRMMKTGDTGFTFFRLLTKTGHWLWVQASARVVFKDGRPDFIIARQKALSNEEGEEHLHQRRRQLPFNLATGEGALYDTWMDAFSMPGPPGPGAPDTAATEKMLDPASVLGSFQRQDHTVYTQPPAQSPQLPAFDQIQDLDLEQPQSSLEQAFLDSRALLSVPGQTSTSQNRTLTGDFTSEAMMDSLEQILVDIGDIGLEGLDVEETELRDWENTLVRMSQEKTDEARDLERILANDVFSYVEEALRRESGGLVEISDQGVQGQHLGSLFSAHEQPAMEAKSGLGGPGWTGLNRTAPSQRHSPHLGLASQLWSTNGSQQHWFPSGLNNNVDRVHASCRFSPEASGHGVPRALDLPGSLQTSTGLRQLLTHSSAAPAESFPPQMQRFSGSCMYEKREGHIPNGAATVPAGLNGSTHAVGTLAQTYPGATVGVQPSAAVGADYPPGNGSLQSSFFCWNGDAQIPNIPMDGVVDPFAFPVLPPGNINISQSSGL